MRKMGRIAIPIVMALLAVACSSSSSTTTSPGAGSAPLTVFAASSLTKAFTQIGQDFHTANPEVTVTFDFGSSTDLAAQIQSEGTAGVFASASGTAMDTIQGDPGVTDRTNFASNQLVIITPPDDPAGISSLNDLTRSGVKLVLAAEGVPVGDYARQALKNAGILSQAMANVVSNEDDDASVVAKVTLGDADAAIVYTSDLASAGGSVRSVTIPGALNVVATYPIAVVTGSSQTDAATAFLNYVVGPTGQATLKEFGFGPAG
jgi:molybdate transport system substrate-binding protein